MKVKDKIDKETGPLIRRSNLSGILLRTIQQRRRIRTVMNTTTHAVKNNPQHLLLVQDGLRGGEELRTSTELRGGDELRGGGGDDELRGGDKIQG